MAKRQGGPVGGRIINTVSGAGLLGNFGQSNYATAKAAIMSLTQTVSLELAGIGVTVNAISPGAVTRLSAGVSGVEASAAKEPDEYDPNGFDALNPAMSSPVVAWLASDQAGHVSGQCIRVMRTQLHLMRGWTESVTIDNGGAYWDAAKLGRRMDAEVFRTRAPASPSTSAVDRQRSPARDRNAALSTFIIEVRGRLSTSWSRSGAL